MNLVERQTLSNLLEIEDLRQLSTIMKYIFGMGMFRL
jgi:hypothetical protein